MQYLTVIVLYLLMLVGVALYQSRKVKTQEDFSVAGRSLSPWILVLTMLATWVGTGSILGNAGKAYRIGLSAFILPLGGTLGIALLTLIAPRVRNYEKFSVPEIIQDRYGHVARVLALISLVAAYLVIVSYQFNAGGGVLQYVIGEKEAVTLNAQDEVTAYQASKGYVYLRPGADAAGEITLTFDGHRNGAWKPAVETYTVRIVPSDQVQKANIEINEQELQGVVAAAPNPDKRVKIKFTNPNAYEGLRVSVSPVGGILQLQEYKLTIRKATLIAAAFIIAFTMIAGLVSVAYIDIGNGLLIILSMLIAFPYFWIKAGGWAGMETAFAAMGRSDHMIFGGDHLSVFKVINLSLPTFLLVLGDANLYQRFFASKSAKGAKQATVVLVFVAFMIESLIVGSGWIAGSLIPDAEQGKYALIVAARYIMPVWLGAIFMTNIVAIIMSTANSFLLVPSTSLIRDIYMAYINPKATDKHILFLSRALVVVLGVLAFMISMTFERVPGFLERALYAFTIYGTSVTPALVAALFWKGATKAGAIVSIFSGAMMTLLWKKMTFMESILGGLYYELDEVLPAFLVSVLSLVAFSLLTRKRFSAR